MRIEGRVLADGVAEGVIALLAAPLSLWSGFDVATGRVLDASHPQHGLPLAGKVLAMPAARGSSSAASSIVEAARLGTAPAAILLMAADPILVMGSLVAADLYGVSIPVLLVRAADWQQLADGARVRVSAAAGDGAIQSTCDV